MAFDSAHLARHDDSWSIIATLAAADGSAAQAMPRALGHRGAQMRDLADAVHALCSLHGHKPGVIEHAAARNTQPPAQDWLIAASESFAVERAYLVKLAAAAGHAPSTPGQAESEAAVLGQRHALEMLAQSDRTGCASGAAIALVLDWAVIRQTLDIAAERFGVVPPAFTLSNPTEIEALFAALGQTPAVERAMAFGAQQLLAQHRGLWDLLESRASARDQL